jgi:hypothetical protein
MSKSATIAFSVRTGVSAVLHEIGDATGLSVVLDEPSVPLSEPVRGACELLGLDPLYVANEGKLLLIAVPKDSERALACLRQHAFSSLLNNPFSDESTSRNTAVFDGSGCRKAFFNRLLWNASRWHQDSACEGAPSFRHWQFSNDKFSRV